MDLDFFDECLSPVELRLIASYFYVPMYIF